MNFEIYSELTQKVVAASQKLAEKNKNPVIEPVHLALALIEEASSPVVKVLKTVQRLDVFKQTAEENLNTLPKVSG